MCLHLDDTIYPMCLHLDSPSETRNWIQAKSKIYNFIDSNRTQALLHGSNAGAINK